MNFLGAPGEAHRDHWQTREQRIPFPTLEGNCSEQIIVTDDSIRLTGRGRFDCIVEADYGPRLHIQRVEESTKMIAEKGMSSNAQHTHSASIYRRPAGLFRGR